MIKEEFVAWSVDKIQLGDRRRSVALGEMSWGLAKANVVTFAAIGRAIKSAAAKASSCIRRVWEFCHNENIDPLVVQAALVSALVVPAATVVVGSIANVVVVALDWHLYDNGAVSGLRLSLMTGTRALPLLWREFWTKDLKGRKSAIECQIIRDLILCRPAGVTWLILLDAGFHSPELLRLLDQAGLFVVRSGSAVTVHSGTRCWTHVRDLPVKTGQVVEFGWLYWSKQNPLKVRVVGARIYDIKPPKPGQRRSTTHRYKYSKPGLCVVLTNLPMDLFPALSVVRLYSRRFEIEHSFRDIKNATYGMNMEHTHLMDPATYSRLMCIVAVTEAALWLVGSEAEEQGLHLDLTPSRPKSGRRVLSLRNVGRLCLEDINASIDRLIEKHLAPTICRILTAVGRSWKNAKESLTLVGLALSPGQLPQLAGGCNRRGKGRDRRCQPAVGWDVTQVAIPQAA
jgi:hypothetical protein